MEAPITATLNPVACTDCGKNHDLLVPPVTLDRPSIGRPAGWIFDVDGTLASRLRANGTERCPYSASGVGQDLPHPTWVLLAQRLHSCGDAVIIATGRAMDARQETLDWLRVVLGFTPDAAYFRTADQQRRGVDDRDVKAGWLQDIRSRFAVMGVFDDRNKVVAMWRENGLACAQVARGDF